MSTRKIKKGSVNAIDVVLIVLIICCVASIVLRFTLLDSILEKRGKSEAEVVFYVDCVRISTVEELKKGTAVYLDTQKIGELAEDMDAGFTPAKVNMTDGSGKTVSVYYPDAEFVRCENKMTVSGTYKEKDGFTLSDGTHLAAGDEMTLYIGSSVLTVSVQSVTLVDAVLTEN